MQHGRGGVPGRRAAGRHGVRRPRGTASNVVVRVRDHRLAARRREDVARLTPDLRRRRPFAFLLVPVLDEERHQLGRKAHRGAPSGARPRSHRRHRPGSARHRSPRSNGCGHERDDRVPRTSSAVDRAGIKGNRQRRRAFAVLGAHRDPSRGPGVLGRMANPASVPADIGVDIPNFDGLRGLRPHPTPLRDQGECGGVPIFSRRARGLPPPPRGDHHQHPAWAGRTARADSARTNRVWTRLRRRSRPG